MRQWTVDAFAAAPFKGNPACVVEPFDAWPEDGWMQALAKENNQAETAFLLRTGDPGRFGLRWFTPGQEVNLCGHATLGSGHVLFQELTAGVDNLEFETRSGPLHVSRADDFYQMDFPANPPSRTQTPDGLEQALGAPVSETWAGRYLIAVLEDEAAVRGLHPDIAALSKIAGEATEGPGQIVAAALADPGRDYQVVSRFFAPGCGVPEDPATGSAHCILSPLFSAKLGQDELKFHQAYPGRGGDIQARFDGDRVMLKGRAVTVIESRLRM